MDKKGFKAEIDFQEAYQKKAKALGINQNPDAPNHFYDYRGAYAKHGPSFGTALDPGSGEVHFPSEFKHENHPNLIVDGVNTKTGHLAKKPEERKKGGPVKKGKPYVVGEEGPEIFIPKQDGKIDPNKKKPGGKMPAKSKSQQRLMGMARGIQTGEMAPSKSPAAAQVAKTMEPGDVEDFASTKHAGLPEKKGKRTRKAKKPKAKRARKAPAGMPSAAGAMPPDMGAMAPPPPPGGAPPATMKRPPGARSPRSAPPATMGSVLNGLKAKRKVR